MIVKRQMMMNYLQCDEGCNGIDGCLNSLSDCVSRVVWVRVRDHRKPKKVLGFGSFYLDASAMRVRRRAVE
jgi:hypothetical protein